jgi:hypothetical protein
MRKCNGRAERTQFLTWITPCTFVQVAMLINLDAAHRAGLKISSKLLASAKIVRDPTATGKS